MLKEVNTIVYYKLLSSMSSYSKSDDVSFQQQTFKKYIKDKPINATQTFCHHYYRVESNRHTIIKCETWILVEDISIC
jgi:hypothetical protein